MVEWFGSWEWGNKEREIHVLGMRWAASTRVPDCSGSTYEGYRESGSKRSLATVPFFTASIKDPCYIPGPKSFTGGILLIYFLPLCHMKANTTLGIMSTYWKKGKVKRFSAMSYICSFDQDHKNQLRNLKISCCLLHWLEPGHMATSGCRNEWETCISCFPDYRRKSKWSAGVQPRLIQGIRSGDGVGDLFIFIYSSKIQRVIKWG